MTERRLTYAEVGATSQVEFPVVAGFRRYERSVRVGEGPQCWRRSTEALMRWEVKTRSGFAVQNDRGAADRAEVGVDYWLVARRGPWRVREPVRVVAVIEEAARVGYAYGTLEGHPIAGEESFVVERRDDDSVWFTLRSLTRPATGRWRLVFPAIVLAQRYYRWRYGRALITRN